MKIFPYIVENKTFLVLLCGYYYYYLIAAPLITQITIIQEVLSDINIRKGESECQYYIDKLEYLDDKQRDPLIDNCKTLLCHGELRNKSGSVRIGFYSFSIITSI